MDTRNGMFSINSHDGVLEDDPCSGTPEEGAGVNNR